MNKNLIKAVVVGLVGFAYFSGAAVFGYKYLPAGLDSQGHEMHGLMAFLAMLAAGVLILAIGGLNSYFESRDEEDRRAAAEAKRIANQRERMDRY